MTVKRASTQQTGAPTTLKRMTRSGDIPVSEWNRLRAYVLSLVNARGNTLTLQGGLPLSATQFHYKSTDGDYIVCRRFNGTADTGQDIAIAKPYLLRPSIVARTIGGTAYTYTYTDDFTRTSDDTASTENQVIVPSYEVDDIIYATRVRLGTNVAIDEPTGIGEQADLEPIIWLDLNVDGRQWAKAAA